MSKIAKTVVCHECGKLLSTKQALAYHLQNVHKQNMRVCCHCCPDTFADKNELASHMESQHPEEAIRARGPGRGRNSNHVKKETGVLDPAKLNELIKYNAEGLPTCGICFQSICTLQGLKYHIRSIHYKEKPFICSTCGKAYSSQGGLNYHLSNEHGEVIEKKNNWSVLSEDDLLRVQVMDDGTLTCTLCSRTARSKRELVAHLKNEHDSRKPFPCHVCSKTYKTLGSLQQHFKKSHPKEVKELFPKKIKSEPDVSSEKTPILTDENLSRLLKVMNPLTGKPRCEICPKDLPSRQMLGYHIKFVHYKTKKPVSCRHCGYLFTSKHGLNGHMKSFHPGELSDIRDSSTSLVRCEVCGKSFTAHALTIHFGKMHPNEKYGRLLIFGNSVRIRLDLICDYCGKKCPTKASLVNHIRRRSCMDLQKIRRIDIQIKEEGSI